MAYKKLYPFKVKNSVSLTDEYIFKNIPWVTNFSFL